MCNTKEVSTNITGVNQAANETGAAATQVLSSSGELSKQSETLSGDVEQFLENIRLREPGPVDCIGNLGKRLMQQISRG